MIWFIIISLFLAFLLWLLFVPVILYTHTETNRYLLTLPGIFRAVVVPDGRLFYLRIWIFFIPFSFHPLDQRKRKRKEKKKPRKTRKPMWRSGNIRAMKAALRAFRIKRLEADIDTDDFTLNAWLVPVFSAVNQENVHLQVNFAGHQSLLLDLRVSLGAVLWNIIKTRYRFLNH